MCQIPNNELASLEIEYLNLSFVALLVRPLNNLRMVLQVYRVFCKLRFFIYFLNSFKSKLFKSANLINL